MPSARVVLLCATLPLLAGPSHGPQSPAPLTVPVSWLAQHLHDRDLVLLHVGDGAEYVTMHIPGARLITLSSLSVSDHSRPEGLMVELPSAQALHDTLAALGVSDRSRIIVYFGRDWVTPSTRIVFTLDYAGLGDRTSLLDGGMPAWIRAGYPVTAEMTAVAPGTLSALHLRPELVASAEYVRGHLRAPGVRIVDARDSSFYLGVRHNESNPRDGHIPGAASIPYVELTDDHLMLLSREDLLARFAKAGIRAGDTVVTYCHVGMQATVPLFVARMLGHPVKLYDGSFQEWSRRRDYPLDSATAKP